MWSLQASNGFKLELDLIQKILKDYSHLTAIGKTVMLSRKYTGRQPKTKPDDIGCESACTGCQSLHPPFIIITQPESGYSFYHPTEGRRLSWPSWLVIFLYSSNSLYFTLLYARAFAIAGPTVWNSLPDSLRDPAVGPDQFRRDLKTHLFEWRCVSFSALAVFSRNALYKSTFYLLTYSLCPRV